MKVQEHPGCNGLMKVQCSVRRHGGIEEDEDALKQYSPGDKGPKRTEAIGVLGAGSHLGVLLVLWSANGEEATVTMGVALKGPTIYEFDGCFWHGCPMYEFDGCFWQGCRDL